MTQIGFDSETQGTDVVVGNMQRADVSGPGGPNAFPAVVKRQVAGETTGKVVCLANVYRAPLVRRDLAAEHVDAGALQVAGPNRVKVHVICAPAGPEPANRLAEVKAE